MPEIREKIAAATAGGKPLSFAQFMQWALYCPVYGYYDKEGDSIGRQGDFYTSVSVGPLFGQLLAAQFAAWLEESFRVASSPENPLHVVEAGAHRGHLARDILTWLQQYRPLLFSRLQYWIVEPSARGRTWQEQTLAAFQDRVRWAAEIEHVAGGRARGVVFANELLDALPVHRFGWDAARRAWFEWGVAVRDDRLVWTRMSPSFDPAPDAPHELLAVLPDGFTLERCPAAEAWWRRAATVLDTGSRLLTFDYGGCEEDFWRPERPAGTLRAFRGHRQQPDLLKDPGHQDLTADVNFSRVEAAGRAAGLRTETFSTQQDFLTRIAGRLWQGQLASHPWTQEHTRQFQTLTHPEHLGRAFRVLVQQRAACPPAHCGASSS